MEKENCFLLGYIVRTHGLRGEVSVFLDVDYPEDYDELDSVFVESRGQLLPYEVAKINLQREGRAIVKLKTVDHIDQAQTLVGSALYLPDDVLDELNDDGFYYHQIPGYTIVDSEKGRLGTVKTVFTPNAQDLIAMDYEGTEVLIPIVDEIVGKVNHDAREIYVNLPDGLLDIYKDSGKSADDAD